MRVILKIAWRNIWRNKLRSLVVIFSIILGIWAGVFVSGFSFGLNTQRIESTIRNNLSHLQVHHAQWRDENQNDRWIEDAAAVEKALTSKPGVAAVSARVSALGMVASARYQGGVRIIGVEGAAEERLTGLAAKVDSGGYFEPEGRNQILIGQALAEKLQVKPGAKVVLTFSDEFRNIISASFKVKGLLDFTSSQLEKSQVFVQRKDLLNLLGAEADQRHEIAALLSDESRSEALRDQMRTSFPQLATDSWRDLAPELAYADELMSIMLYVVIGIIMLALSFGIINTMLMAVLERRKELGMLMGVGMNRGRVFSMILWETILLSLCGGPLGILLGYLSIEITHRHGVELQMFSRGLESFGISATVYPTLMTSFYWGVTLLVVVMAILSSLYPARMALKLNPVETIRTI